MNIGILEPDGFDQGVIRQLSELGSVSLFDGQNLAGFLADVEVLFVRLGYSISESFLNSAPNLRFLCSPTTGHTHIDEETLKTKQTSLISLRGEREFLNTIRATPEHTFGLILALLRQYKPAFCHVAQGFWDRDQLKGEELFGKTVGIIGLGRVGCHVATYCQAFGANVVYCDIKSVVGDDQWQQLDDIQAVIMASDIVVLAASYTTGEPPIIGSDEVTALSGRYFVNTARGELVDEPLLISAIKANALKGAAIDVISDETGENALDQWRQLALQNNLIITPHIAGATTSSMARTEGFIASKLVGQILENQ